MKFVARDLLSDPEKPKLAWVYEQQRLTEALGTMLEHDFSQVPVCQGEPRDTPLQKSEVLGIVTRASCLQAMRQFSSLGLNSLSLSDVIVKAVYVNEDEEIDEILGRLQSESSVLLLEPNDDIVTGIITHADTTRYFRQHADDVMRVRFVEETMKKLLLLAFDNNQSRISDAAPGSNLLPVFIRALRSYLGPELVETFDNAKARQAFNSHFERSRSFDQLTLADFIGVLTSHDNWSRFEGVFGDDTRRRAILDLLDKVRKIRNALAHFREFSESERETLRFAADWIDRHFGLATAVFEAAQVVDEELLATTITKASEVVESADADTPASPQPEPEPQPEEVESAQDGPFGRLAAYLRARPQAERTFVMSFDEIEATLKHKLPRSARDYRTWWANSIEQPQAKHWLDADWRVNRVNMSAESVVFGRIEAREREYIRFFSTMIQDLRANYHPRWLTERNPRGTSWHTFADAYVEDLVVGRFNVAFGFGDRVRVEIYIDSGDAKRNERLLKWLFDRIKLDGELIWSPIEDKRACRVHREFEGNIRLTESELAELRRVLNADLVAFVDSFVIELAKLSKNDLSRA